MKPSSLKSLDWESLLKNSSHDEYDSDETICEEHLDVEESISKNFQNNHVLTKPTHGKIQPMDHDEIEQVDVHRISPQLSVTSNYDIGRSNDEVFHCSTRDEKNLNEIFILKNSKYLSGAMVNNCGDSSESSFKFSNTRLNFSEAEKDLTVTDRNSFTELKEVTQGDNNTNTSTSYVSTFGFTNMSFNDINGTKHESQIKTGNKPNLKLFLNDSSERERSSSSEMNISQELNCVTGSSWTDLNKDELDGCKIPSEKLIYFEDKIELSLNDKEQNRFQEYLHEETLNLDPANSGLTHSSDVIGTGTLKKDMYDSTECSYNERGPDVDNSSSLSDNYYLGISTESLGNIIGNDFIENFETPSVQEKNTCSPPLTLIEKRYINNIKSNKILSYKKMKNKREIPAKTLPARKCSSKYINQSKRCTKSQELSEPSSESYNKKIFKTRGRSVNNDTSQQEKQIDEYSEAEKSIEGETAKKKIRRLCKKSKVLKEKNCSQNDDYVKVTLLQHLKKMEQALNDIEQKTYKWVNGEEDHCMSREKAFGMLMETQGICKTIESYQVPVRCRRKFTQVKCKLSDRANKLAFAIDAAISESDQMFRQEYNDKLFDSKSRSSEEAFWGNEVRKRMTVQNSKFNCSGVTGSTFSHRVYENNRKKQHCQEVYLHGNQQNADFGSKIKNKFNKENQRGNNDKPKPILKYTDSESLTEKCVTERKHISFSDNIEFCNLSGTITSSLSNSEEIDNELNTKQSRENFIMEGTNAMKYENQGREENLVHNTYSIFSKNNLQANASDLNDEKTGDQIVNKKSHKSILGNTVNEMYYDKSVEERDNLENSTQITGQKNPLECQYLKTSNETQIQEKNHYESKGGEVKYISEEFTENHLHTIPSNSEGSTEGFGFSEEQANQVTWGDISIMDIKYIRIKSPDEFNSTQDDDWLKDLDKW